jgi:hypothetical protein
MTKILTGIAALMIVGAAAPPVPAGAVEQGITKAQPTDLSSRHRGWRHHRYYGHRYWGPRYRYGYYGNPYRYGYYGSPYYRRPGLAFGIGPFGFGVF